MRTKAWHISLLLFVTTVIVSSAVYLVTDFVTYDVIPSVRIVTKKASKWTPFKEHYSPNSRSINQPHTLKRMDSSYNFAHLYVPLIKILAILVLYLHLSRSLSHGQFAIFIKQKQRPTAFALIFIYLL